MTVRTQKFSRAAIGGDTAELRAGLEARVGETTVTQVIHVQAVEAGVLSTRTLG
jgi:hypothetical protein